MNLKLSHSAAVFYELSVMENGRVIRKLPRRKNLILDQGLNLMATVANAGLFTYAAVGTGTTETKRDSGTTTFTLTGTALVASGNFFVAGDVGRLFKFDVNGGEFYLSAYTDPQNMTVSGAGGAIGPFEGTIWYVNQTGLVAETQRTSTVTVTPGENSGIWNAPEKAWEMKRTFLFPVVGAPVTLNEIGWSPSSGAGGNLFGRDIIQPGVSLLAGQQLKASVTLRWYISPTVPTAWVNPITGGFGDDGQYMFTAIPADNPNAIHFPSWVCVPSAASFDLYMSTGAPALPLATTVEAVTFNIYTNQLCVMTSAAYVTGSFKRDYTGSISSSGGVGSAWRSFVCLRGGASAWRDWHVLMNTPQTKANTHRLDLTFRISWGRTLVN